MPTTFSAAPAYQHPTGRLIAYGAAALSDAELLAIILRTGTAHETALRLAGRILAHYGGLRGLAQAKPAEIQEIMGIGDARVAQIIAVAELGQRLLKTPGSERPLITSAADAAPYIADVASLPQENVRVLLLDSARRLIAAPTIYIGTIDTSAVRVAEIYREAVRRSAPALILAHNHPSGDPTPSPADIELTRGLESAGRLLDIVLVDHLIVGREGWVSLREQGFIA